MQRALITIALSLSACTVADPHFFRPDGGNDGPSADAADQVDGGVDGPAQASFDVAFVNEWRMGTSATGTSQYEWVRIANTGTSPLDLSTATVTNVIDSHNQIDVAVTWEGPAIALSPDMSAGALTPAASALIVAGSIMTEPAQDASTNLFHLTVTDLPGTWLVDPVEVTLQIENARATLPFNLVSSGTGSNTTAYSADRVSSAPL